LPDAGRIERRLEELWQIARGPAGGADRPAFSGAEAQAMLLVAGWARELGLEPGLDPHGNLWALPPGDGPLVTSGSHVDTVPDGGRYDGALGTVLGLEFVADLPPGTSGLLICVAEEAPRFGAGTIGSRLLTGALSEGALAGLHDSAGVSAEAARAGEYLAALPSLARIEPPLSRWRAHAEIHVAQRRALREIGIVTRVASPRRFELELTGEAGHSGEVAMTERRDALAAAAEVILAVERAARAAPAGTVATVGTMSVSPGAVSVIPGRASLGLDARGIDRVDLDALEGAIRAAVAEIAHRRNVAAELRLVRGGDPVALDPGLAAAAGAAAAALGVPVSETWSGAGHDAQHLTRLAPALLLFVPLHGGESHTPQEGAEMHEILQAARVASRSVGSLELDSGPRV
jgi:hydantoinase/carbamoylase family amidase